MNKKPPVGKRFEKGNKANPLGAGAHNKDVRALRRISQEDVAAIGQLIIEGDIEKLKEVRNDPASTVLKVWMCAVAIKAIDRGDAAALTVLLDRIVGKVKEKVEVTSNNKTEISTASKSVIKQIIDDVENEF